MTHNKWVVYLLVFGLVSILGAIGDSTTTFISASDVNSAVGYQVDEVASGSGFVSFVRSVGSFFITTLPKLVSFNYTFLQGDLEVVRYLLIFVFGGSAVIMLFFQFVGSFQVNR